MAKKSTKEGFVLIRTVDGSLIQGKINIGVKDRISDIFLEGDTPFVTIYDACSPAGKNKVYIINKRHIVWVEPDEDSCAS